MKLMPLRPYCFVALISVPFAAVKECVRAVDHGTWIAVVAPALEKEIEPLAEARRKEGWQVTVLKAEADAVPVRQRIAALTSQQPEKTVCVLLAGQTGEFVRDGSAVPAGKGTILRMKDQPTDAVWTRSVEGRVFEVGRLPARSAAEARVMVQKILAWPVDAAAGLPDPVARLVAGYHEAPPAFAKIADNLTNTLTNRLVERLPAAWRLEAGIHVNGTAWPVPTQDLSAAARRMMTSRSTMLAYMGHSGPEGAVSTGVPLFSSRQWQALPAGSAAPGLFFTCGCHSCSLSGDGESYSLAAVRAPGGPPAVIGALGESWAAMGYLAMSGLTARLAAVPEMSRAGEFWMAAREGLEKGEISAAEFAMMDMADGTRGRVPLEQQRQEHLEMWMLLGDPAMPLIPAQPRIPVKLSAEPAAGSPCEVTGTLPAALAGESVRVTFERHPGSLPESLPAVPEAGPQRAAAMRERNRLATDTVITSAEAKVAGAEYSATLMLPAVLPPRPWTIRVAAGKGSGVIQIR